MARRRGRRKTKSFTKGEGKYYFNVKSGNQMITIYRSTKKKAMDAFQRLPQRHPRSSFADRSLYRLGRLYQAQGTPEDALKAYNRLLSTYPNSLLAGDVREHIRALRRSG